MTHKFASYLLFAAAALGVSTVPALATSVCPDDVSLTTYLANGFSCQVGDLIFSNFTYTSSAAGSEAFALPSTGVTVDTLGSLTGMDPASFSSPTTGLEFNGGWTAGVDSTSDAAIGFTVTEAGGGSMDIEDFGLAQVAGVTPTGQATVTEEGCGPAPCTPGALETMTFNYGGTDYQNVSDTIFAPTGSVQVVKDINVTGYSGEATLSVVQDTFSEVPEPRSLALVLGLALAGLLLRKKFQGEAA